MAGWIDRYYFALAVMVYGITVLYSIFVWRQGFRRDNWIVYLLLLLGFSFHSFAMLQRGFSDQRCPINNLFEATIFVGWAMLAMYLVLGLWHKLRFLGVFASPILFIVSVFALMPSIDTHLAANQTPPNVMASFHGTLSLLAYGAFGLSGVAGIMFLTQEHNLKFNKLRAVSTLLPPLQRLELAAGNLLISGWILLTAGLFFGLLRLKQAHGVFFMVDAKIIWALGIWSVYLGLIVARWWFAQRGRRLAWGSIATFIFVLLTFWSSNLLSTLHHP